MLNLTRRRTQATTYALLLQPKISVNYFILYHPIVDVVGYIYRDVDSQPDAATKRAGGIGGVRVVERLYLDKDKHTAMLSGTN